MIVSIVDVQKKKIMFKAKCSVEIWPPTLTKQRFFQFTCWWTGWSAERGATADSDDVVFTSSTKNIYVCVDELVKALSVWTLSEPFLLEKPMRPVLLFVSALVVSFERDSHVGDWARILIWRAE